MYTLHVLDARDNHGNTEYKAGVSVADNPWLCTCGHWHPTPEAAIDCAHDMALADRTARQARQGRLFAK